MFSGGAGAATNTIYFDGATCKCPNATAGDVALINGTVYTAVNNTTIDQRLQIKMSTYVLHLSQIWMVLFQEHLIQILVFN